MPVFETLRWTAPGAELDALSSQPASCLNYEPQAERLVQAGNALFDAPSLLGGQAAKAGLSCASCHVNGRDNPHFLLTGVSEKPGTADVTNSFFSAARGNRRFDPVQIPDLAFADKVSRNPADGLLEPFIRNQIVEEFAGNEPSKATLQSLAAYVRAITPCATDDKVPAKRRLEDQLARIDGALASASYYANKGDDKQASLLLATVRHQLGLVSERFTGAKLQRERALLLHASRDLQGIGRRREPADNFEQAIINWQSRFDAQVRNRLLRKEALSLYNPDRLRTLVAPQRKNR